MTKNAANQEFARMPSHSTDTTSMIQAKIAAFRFEIVARTSGRARVRCIFWSIS